MVTMLYKKGHRSEVRNYRPITLLNSDYKILTRILAKRMLNIVTQFVSKAQIGFVPRTFIAEATRLMQMIQLHLDNIDEGGIFIFLDMEKAFDRVSWRYLKKALKALKFTAPYMSWIETLYNERNPPKRRVYANGAFSSEYSIFLGVAQGCPLSPLLFLPIMESLTRLVNTDEKFRGIKIGDTEHRSSHFADDSTIFAKGPCQIPRFNILSKIFCKGTNMKENEDKREILGVGSLGKVDPATLTTSPVWSAELNKLVNPGWKSPGEHVISLGVPIGNQCGNFEGFWKGINLGAKAKLANVRRVQDIHQIGKHRLVNANYYGKHRYWMYSLALPENISAGIESDARLFLWKRNPELDKTEVGSKGHIGKWVSKNVEYKPVKEGGLGFMRWKDHEQAFLASWIVRLLEPREARWKDMIRMWISPLPLYTFIQQLTSREKRALLEKIPDPFFASCAKAFWRMRIKPKLDYADIKYWEEVDSTPVLRNGLFKFAVRESTAEVWRHPAFRHIGSLFDPSPEKGPPRFFTPAEVRATVKVHFPQKTAGQCASIAAAHKRMVQAIPRELLAALKTPTKPIEWDSIIGFRDEEGMQQLGRLAKDGQHVHLLRVDESGFGTVISEPIPVGDLDENDFHRISLWGSEERKFRPIMGHMAVTYPKDKGWTLQGGSDILRLSQLSIKRLTSSFQKKPATPNAQKSWEAELGRGQLPWKTIWGAQGSFLANPRDEKTMQKILHRGLFLRSRDSKARNKNCRVCRRRPETTAHLPICPRMRAARQLVTSLWEEMGVQPEQIDVRATWLFGLIYKDASEKKPTQPLGPCQRALLVLYWRVIYKHMTLQEMKRRTFITTTVSKDIGRHFMARILAYQATRRRFYQNKKHAGTKGGRPAHELPQKAAQQIAPIGELKLETGKLTIRKEIRRILKGIGVWRRFR